MGAAVAAIIVARERRAVEAFRLAGATDRSRAVSLTDLSFDPDDLGIRRLRDHAVIRESQPGLFYLDEEVWQAWGRTRRRIAIIIAIVLLLVLWFGLFASAKQ
jgi:hypothetical protein